MAINVVEQFKKHWDGPAVAVHIGEKKTLLGDGEPEATVTIRDTSVLRALLMSPSLGFGEAYERGTVVVDGDLLAVLRGFYQSFDKIRGKLHHLHTFLGKLPDTSLKAKKNAQHHYDVGNEFYKLWLDPSMTYSCAYFPTGTESLEEAQHLKRDLICKKLRLEPGMKLLDIGSGWGSLLFHAAENYGVEAVGITPAKEQAARTEEEIEKRGLKGKVSVLTDDWRTLEGEYDRLVSVGMFEHVGQKQYELFFERWVQMLKPDGLSLLHTIGRRTPGAPDPWIQRYIFPGGQLPALTEVAKPATEAGLRVYRVENLRPHYAKTLQQWAQGFTDHREEVEKDLGEEFARRWWLYLQGSEAGFRWGELDLYQLELYPAKNQVTLDRELKS